MGKESLKKIYLVRHGQSVDNARPVYQSRDSPLSELGQEQAKQLAERLSKVSFDALLTSSYPRAVETAGFIAKETGKKPEIMSLFSERRKPSNLDGKSIKDEIANKLWDDWVDSLFSDNLRVEDGENYDDVVARADEALDYLMNREESSIVVATHGFFIRVLILRAILGSDLTPALLRDFHLGTKMSNTGLSIIEYGQVHGKMSWRLSVLNDQAHLG